MVVIRVNTCFPAMYVLLYYSILLLSLFGQGSNLRSSNSECNIYLAMGSIFELEAQITSAHIHTYIYQHTKHNNSLSVPTVDYTAHYCGQLFVGFCYNFPGSLQKSIITLVLHFGGNQNVYENSMIRHYSNI